LQDAHPANIAHRCKRNLRLRRFIACSSRSPEPNSSGVGKRRAGRKLVVVLRVSDFTSLSSIYSQGLS
jgi:hypothetical protein